MRQKQTKLKAAEVDAFSGFLNKRQAAELLNMSVASIDRMIMRRQIPFYKPRGRVLFKKDDLLNWVEGYRFESA